MIILKEDQKMIAGGVTGMLETALEAQVGGMRAILVFHAHLAREWQRV